MQGCAEIVARQPAGFAGILYFPSYVRNQMLGRDDGNMMLTVGSRSKEECMAHLYYTELRLLIDLVCEAECLHSFQSIEAGMLLDCCFQLVRTLLGSSVVSEP